ncbi:hypothetical protein B0E53_06929 [Micromonospora sp. MH33]|uniref:hypothetical protein n=1 Tax=Micromonospora sp. MH33 TaxID=1945509 RepID=UPI000D2C6FD9|nr:hypothetical protein [Micromonospora sp. MH33]PSK59020.1 hypothetical protein B0E53_06929 [Micromonospora sp. MH33]
MGGVAELPAGCRVVLLAEQADVVAQVEQPGERLPRLPAGDQAAQPLRIGGGEGLGGGWAVAGVVPADHGRQVRETPQEILDRRFALGEIDAVEYRRARAHLTGRDPGPS